MNRPKLVGVTGGIGSGKSTVCKVFEVAGFKAYYADDRAKFLMEHDPELTRQIRSIFGERAYNKNGLDRKFLAGQAFKNIHLLTRLNELVHPAVGKDFETWVAQNYTEVALLKEAALLFETGLYKTLDFTVLVIADRDLRIQRVLQRDPHRDREGVEDIISRQMADAEKLQLADFVIRNNGDESVIGQVMEVSKKLG